MGDEVDSWPMKWGRDVADAFSAKPASGVATGKEAGVKHMRGGHIPKEEQAQVVPHTGPDAGERRVFTKTPLAISSGRAAVDALGLLK